MRIEASDLKLLKPRAWQEVDGEKREIGSRYVLKGRHSVGFEVGPYDHSRPLVIDPIINYATYLGGGMDEIGYSVATDAAGNSYVAGYTSSTDFPATTGAYKTTNQGGASDAFVAKYNTSGVLQYATYVGGSGADIAYGIAVDGASPANAYITGSTASSDFPATAGAPDMTLKGTTTNAFIAKLNPMGNGLLYATYLGGTGTDAAYGIAVDANNEATVAGSTTSSTSFPLMGAFQPAYGGGTSDAFITRLNATGTGLLYSTFLGGSGQDEATAIALDSNGNAYVTGFSNSPNFPVHNAAHGTNSGDFDAFVTVLNTSGNGLVYSTLLGGSQQDFGLGIAVDANANAYVTGSTASTNFPVTGGVLQSANAGGYDAFITRLTSVGVVSYSTYLGGSGDDYAWAIAADSTGNAFIAGDTGSANFPTTADAIQTTNSGEFNVFLAMLQPGAAPSVTPPI